MASLDLTNHPQTFSVNISFVLFFILDKNRIMRLCLWFILPFFVFTQCKGPDSSPYPLISADLVDTATAAMIVSAHPLATRAGLSILREGGNAVDATIATQFALAVVYPRAGNIGGGGFLVLREPNGTATTLDFREKAPKRAHERMYRDSLDQVVSAWSLEGPTASGVPGTPAGLYAAFEKYSQLKNWALLVAPAIQLAERGFAITASEANRLNRYQADFKKWNASSFCPMIKDSAWQPGDILVQRRLAETLKKIQEEGPDAFYRGALAEQIEQFMDTSGGYMRQDDLNAYEARWREPIQIDYKNYRMISMPPPSSGGIALGQLLLTLEQELQATDIFEPQAAHAIVEAERRTYADRAQYLGDNDFVDIPDYLLDSSYLRQRWKSFDPDRATQSTQIGLDSIQIQKESFETTHTSAVDADGLAVSLTTTLNSNYGSKVMHPQGGFFFNNEMDDFSAKPGVPNQFGLVGSQANAIAPEKRMLSSMTPTIFEQDGELYLIIGSPGGSAIITTVLQVFLHLTQGRLTLQEALERPRFHHQWIPDYVMIEREDWPNDLGEALQLKGHQLDTLTHLGLVKAILKRDSLFIGAGDPRSNDHAEGLSD
jgi:gamma-glutamyltranspeptidase/glutathione hydrolase